ncbi:MAG: anhydro-N-acetylmuramic acid kinase [Gammaproteobacteria bacterium]|nr:anhydro-N-acetylmuramic acid kinase [Gammaproteobacteria bacterium]
MYLGVMSGTSMDAVDLAVVDFNGARPSLVTTASSAWPQGLLERLRAFAGGTRLDAHAVAVLDTEVGLHIATAINTLLHDSAIASGAIHAIGSHGQTVAHAPGEIPPTTLQLGDANVIAEATGIRTINDFRRRDVAAGGQGAPLAPAFHAATLRDADEDRVVLNLGGIANITVLPADLAAPVIGFDTGPANCLMDYWASHHLDQAYDQAGAWAAGGTVDAQLLQRLLDDPYFDLSPPKSTGTQYFSPAWLQRRLTGSAARPEDVQATLLALTAESVAAAVTRFAPSAVRILVCGGGVHNTALMRYLARTLNRPVESSAAYGIDPDWMEAMAFAWLAMRTCEGLAGNLPSVTAAAGERILGAIHPA